MGYYKYRSNKPTMNVQEAIKTIETLGGYKFLGRETRYNRVKGCMTTHYIFDGGEFACIGQLRFYAKQFAYTHKTN